MPLQSGLLLDDTDLDMINNICIFICAILMLNALKVLNDSLMES